METTYLIALIHVFAICLTIIPADAEAASPKQNKTVLTSPKSIPVVTQKNFFKRLPSPHVLVDPDYYVWGMTTMRWKDGKIHGFYSRWPKSKGFKGWMTHCEIAHAVADRPEGPFKTTGTVIESRHLDGWDIVTAHNPSVCVANGKIHLYYVSNALRGDFKATNESPFPSDNWLKDNREIVRNRQCIGVASADTPAGPFVRVPKPVVVPHGSFKNIAVNPAVAYHKGQFVMIVKGDDNRRKDWFRIQLVGHADKATGPFVFQKQAIYDNAQTEDACIWYNQADGLFHSLIHVMGKPVLAHLVSEDSYKWREAKPFTFMHKQIELSDGTIWKPKRVERPFVLTDEKGRAEWVYLAIYDKEISGNIAIPLNVGDAEQDVGQIPSKPALKDAGGTPTSSKTETKRPEPLADQWELVGEAINEPGWDIWGSSPIRDDDGKIHLFCARWPGNIPFIQAWKRNSEIAHYMSDRPEGPFKYVATIGKGIGKGWNAVGYHNPNIRKIGDKYVLVFISNDDGPKHGPNQRIGMMVADSLNGPWKLVPDEKQPLLSPPEDKAIWCHDSGCGVNNPSLLTHPDGRFLLYFKAMSGPRSKGKVKMGVAIANKLDGPYVIQKDPITANDRAIEDGYAFIWKEHVCLITTDNHGILEKGGGLLWISKDGTKFESKPLHGFHHLRRFYLNNKLPKNIKHHYGNEVKFERPQILMGKDGEPEYLYCPSGSALDGSDGTNAYVLRRKKHLHE
ncbi:MAG: glycoside hydrolase family protein [Lentisphaeria bacterium]|nr:glycoside hydrolase family protein [Lentisphaeria bacterium]